MRRVFRASSSLPSWSRSRRCLPAVKTSIWTSLTSSVSTTRSHCRANAQPVFPQGVPGVTQGIPPEYHEEPRRPAAATASATAGDDRATAGRCRRNGAGKADRRRAEDGGGHAGRHGRGQAEAQSQDRSARSRRKPKPKPVQPAQAVQKQQQTPWPAQPQPRRAAATGPLAGARRQTAADILAAPHRAISAACAMRVHARA